MMKKGFLSAIILLLVCSHAVQGQKVALVLSGGGAKGFAHVGVLKALEENHIPIDCIAGTSMGAIVGGLYAAGYSPLEIERFITSADFERWVRGEIGEEYIYYFKDPDPNASWISLKFDIDSPTGKFTTRLPTSLISPYQMDFAILELFGPSSAAGNYDFDSLFVPFRCVASDIDSNRYVVLQDGQLGTAIRASATYPFYFKPIRLDGKLLFDGGLYNNFPVNVADECFRPDIIIGSRATSNVRVPEEYDLLSHVMNMIVNETDYSVPEDRGIMIFTNLPPINVIDFSLKTDFIDSGYVAANEMMPEILQRIQHREERSELLNRRFEFNRKKPDILIDSIEINGLNKSQASYINKLLRKRSHVINLESVKKEYFKLIADNRIKDVFPTLVYAPERGFYTLELDIVPAENFVAQFGGNIGSSAANAAFVGLEYRLLANIGLNVSGNGYFGRFYSSANAEVRIDLPSAFPFFAAIDYTYNHKDYFRNTTYFFEDKTPTFLIQNENHFGLHIGIPSTNKGKFVLGAFNGYTSDDYYQDNYFTRLDTADQTRFNFSLLNLDYELNSLNNKQLATSGAFFRISLKYINGIEKTVPGSTSVMEEGFFEKEHDWIQLRLIYDNYFKTFRWIKLGFYFEALLSNMPEFSNYTATILRAPAFGPIPEMNTLFLPKYRSPDYVAAGLKVLFNVYRNFYFRTEAYYFQPYRELGAGENQEVLYRQPWSDHSFAGTVSMEYHLPFGPISLSCNYYDRAENRFSVLFNIGYILFNKSAFE